MSQLRNAVSGIKDLLGHANDAKAPAREGPRRTFDVRSSPSVQAASPASARAVQRDAVALLAGLAQEGRFVGDLVAIDYETAVVQVHDSDRARVAGIPSLCMLVATRIAPGSRPDPDAEDAVAVLLRVVGTAPLPDEREVGRLRTEVARRAAGGTGHWDAPEHLDPYTANEMSFAGLKCRVVGTFYVDASGDRPALRFGGDLANFSPSKGMKVYKPDGAALATVVNHRDASDAAHPLADLTVEIGRVRYASTDRRSRGETDTPVQIAPTDLLAQKTALFGMTRTGKSNTTKIVAAAVFALRSRGSRGRVGMLVFDPQGEYANDNVQDASGGDPASLRRVWRTVQGAKADDVVTYGTAPHPNDPARRIMRFNFFRDENLDVGKAIVDEAIKARGVTAAYVTNFMTVRFQPPHEQDRSSKVRYERAILAWRAVLAAAGYDPGRSKPSTKGLFNADLLEALERSKSDDGGGHRSAAKILREEAPAWDALAQAMKALGDFIERGAATGYETFNRAYIEGHAEGRAWHDDRLLHLLGILKWPYGVAYVGDAKGQHAADVDKDYADWIYEDLTAGRLVIVDQSLGEADANARVAERVMWRVFRGNQSAFSQGRHPPEILVFAEEAHNLLPSDGDLKGVWVRVAKEGAKLRIGMVYATQEISSIHPNILKNTANWFIGHLNSADETRTLVKFYDFGDFEPGIRRAQDKGFVRVKTLSNQYVVPVQVRRFSVD